MDPMKAFLAGLVFGIAIGISVGALVPLVRRTRRWSKR